MQILEKLLIVMDNAVFTACLRKQPHQIPIVRAFYKILVLVGLHISFFSVWKQAVELFIKILPVSFTKRKSHAETKNAIDACFDTQV